MGELTDWDIEYCRRMAGDYGNSGYMVKTKNGLTGRIKHSDELVNGKQPVYTDKGHLLCNPAPLTVIGFID